MVAKLAKPLYRKFETQLIRDIDSGYGVEKVRSSYGSPLRCSPTHASAPQQEWVSNFEKFLWEGNDSARIEHAAITRGSKSQAFDVPFPF
jgi:hypothetical protein